MKNEFGIWDDITDLIILQAEDVQVLGREISSHLCKGWKLKGELIISTTTLQVNNQSITEPLFIQQMVKCDE